MLSLHGSRHGRRPIVPTAAYDEIADWYEQEFLGKQQASGGGADADPLGIDRALRDLLGQAAASAWRSAVAPASTPPGSASWAGRRSGSTCRPECCGTPEAASPWRRPMPNGYPSGTARCPPPSR